MSALTAAPHRVMFLPGALQAVAAMVWWWLELSGGIGIDSALPSPAVHAWLMLYGLFPFFIFGFLFTAMPNWLETGAIPRPHYLAAAATMAAGAALFYPGIHQPELALAGTALHLAGWGIGLYALLAGLRRSGVADRAHARAAWSALLLGWLGGASYLLWLTGAAPFWLDLAVQLGLWGFLTPLFLIVCHRMIPWFTSRVLANYVPIRPYWALWTLLAACLVHGALSLAGQAQWTWLADLPLAALTLWLTTRWGIARTFGVRLLAMLHIGFVWAGLAFALSAGASLAAWFGHDPGFGRAPLHALGIGFFGSMLIGMASRVSLGHSGRKLEADGFTWALFWLVQVAALARMLPDLAGAPDALVVVSAGLWLAAFVPWAGKYAPLYWRPRQDGKPG